MSGVKRGAPEPPGVTLDEQGANVALWSANASAVDICFFDDADHETARIRLPARTGDVHHGHIGGMREGQRYGFRVHGANAPHDGHRFNANKLLIDPYALALDRALKLHPAMFAHGDHAQRDSAPFVAKAIALRPKVAAPLRPRHDWRDAVIYELHVKGFSAANPSIPEAMRGTFAALAHPASLAHFKKLGVTTLELLPCAAWIDERHLASLGLTNYWGYNPVAFMAPDPRLAPGGWEEVRASIAALQSAGFEVIVDVVFNHSGESDELGPTLSLRGIDNASYYRLADDGSRYVNDAGCGNILAFDRAPVVRLAMDALRAWALYGGVDRFRFDLATTLGRLPSGYSTDAPFLAAIAQDPLLRDLKLIAEPWDLGPGGYQLGAFPSTFAEWNDRYRDTMRRFWRGDPGGVGALATRFSGSQDFFARRRPSNSVNFIVAHDGFTLRDLVSYAQKHNDANGEDNRDGTNDNLSWNNGAEGATDDPAVLAARARDERNLLATLLLSRGAPMLSMGAELGQTQNGNNNAYAQDNATSWLGWSKADAALIDFCAKLIALRKAHPALRDDRFLDGAPQDTSLIPDVEWLTADGAPMSEEDWRDDTRRLLVASLYAQEDRVVVILHRGEQALFVTPPAARDGFEWRFAIDTSREEAGEAIFDSAVISPRSVALLVEAPSALRRAARAAPLALLAQLAQAAGVATQWHDVDGKAHDAPRETLTRLLRQLDLPANTLHEARDSLARLSETRDRRALPQAIVAREGGPLAIRLAAQNGRLPTGLIVSREDGEEERIASGGAEAFRWRGVDGRANEGALMRLPALACGRHTLRLEDGTACALTVAPTRSYLPPEASRDFGFSAQLYSLRRGRDQGIGDFTTLLEIARRSGEAGAALLAINPLHALFANDRMRASPYYPSDRRFLDPIYIDLRNLYAFLGEDVAFDDATAAALRATADVDYAAVGALKDDVLLRAFERFMDLTKRQPEAAPVEAFARFVADGAAPLARFAFFEAISAARKGESWRLWPQELREGRAAALAGFAKEHATEIRYRQFLQWLADAQLSEAAQSARDAGVLICRDLAVGAAPDGAESWSGAGSPIEGFAIGAPPDAFSREGQVWGLPAPDPLKIEADGGADFAELLRANMRHAGALRIDHVMGLARLFVVPEGATAREGTYLSYPLDALLAQVALESHRAHCIVIGEDLGTLPFGFRERLEAENILSYRVVWFERAGEAFRPPAHYPRGAMACVATHDLPTLEGFWSGADIEEKSALGLIDAATGETERAIRAADKRALIEALRLESLIDDSRSADSAFDDALAAALHAFAAKSPSRLAMAQLDDLAGEPRAVNLPGTDRERPNWRRKLGPGVAELFQSPRARAIIRALCRNKNDIASVNDASDNHLA